MYCLKHLLLQLTFVQEHRDALRDQLYQVNSASTINTYFEDVLTMP